MRAPGVWIIQNNHIAAPQSAPRKKPSSVRNPASRPLTTIRLSFTAVWRASSVGEMLIAPGLA